MKTCQKICNQCPFRKDSAKGWLGHMKASDLVDSIKFELIFGCHLLLSDDAQQNVKDMKNGIIPICRGFLASSRKSAKMFGSNPLYGEHLLRLQKTITDEEKDLVLATWEIEKYHNNL